MPRSRRVVLALVPTLVLALTFVLAASPAPPAAPPAATDHDSRRQEKRESRDAFRAGDFDAPTIGWREGPVRYLLSQDEDRTYRHLATRDERARFIQRFWNGRDPDMSTPDNECRTLFYQRVASAARLFTAESTKPGWKTDRGKIYILLGPPDDLDETALRQQEAEVITWTYRDPPLGSGASPNSQVRFVRDASGEYRLTTGMRMFSGETQMSAALSMQALQIKSLPGTHPTLDHMVDSAGPEVPGSFRAHADVFRAADGLALVVLTLWVKEDLVPGATGAGPAGTPATTAPDTRPPAAEVLARLVEEGPTARTYDLAGTHALRPGPGDLGRGPDGTRIFQGGVVVRPGTYTLYCAVAPRGGTPIQSLRDTLVVAPQDDGTLALGPIALAAHLERLPEPATSEYTAPFVLGRLRVVPRIDDLFDAGQDFSFYYQVLGATTDPIEGRPYLDLEYRFFALGAGPGGAAGYQPFGRPIRLTGQQSVLQGFSLTLDGWAPGSYRLEVEVTDSLSGASVRGETGFRVR